MSRIVLGLVGILVAIPGPLSSAGPERDTAATLASARVNPSTALGAGRVATSATTRLPIVVSDEKWRPLRSCFNPMLQESLEHQIDSRALWSRLAGEGRLAVGVVDLADIERPRFARVNGNTMMYAASLPKIAILLAAHQSFQDRVLEETPEMHRTLTEMIRVSSNTAATHMIDVLGYDRIADVLTRPDHRLYDPSQGGGLWVGKRYAQGGERRPDPLGGFSHAASVTQVCRFYYMLATGRLVSPERCRQMLDAMAEPAIHHKFVRTLDRADPDARLYRKSGTWQAYHSDSVLVWGDEQTRFIAVALVEHPRGGEILEQLITAIESAIAAR